MFQQLHPIIKAKKRAIVRMNHNLLLFKTMRLHQFVQVRTNKGAAAQILFLVHHPVGFDMGYVVEVDAAEGQHPQVFGHGYFARVGQGIARAAEFERDEGVEASREILLPAQPVEVVDAVGDGFDVAVKDGGVGRDAEPVGGIVHREPLR